MIDKNSFFLNIPINLEIRQIFIFEGIRICAQSIHLAHIALLNELLAVSTNNKRENSFSIIFKEAWFMIDASHRLFKLISQLPENENAVEDNDLASLASLRLIRNTFHHVDEKIDEFMVEMNAPIWGSLTWLWGIDDDNINSFSLTLGCPRENFEYRVCNPHGVIMKQRLDVIILESVKKDKADKAIIINLSDLYNNVVNIIKKLDSSLKNQLNKNEEVAKDSLPQDAFFNVVYTRH